MTMGFKIINTNALGQLYTNKYNDLKDAHFSEKGLKQTDERVIVLVWTEVMYWHAIHIRERKIKSSKL